MPVLSDVDAPSAEALATNRRHHEGVRATLRERLAWAQAGGSPAAHAVATARGKQAARARIEALLDEGTAFLELSALAAWGQYDNAVPSAGIVTGIGQISGHTCMVVANDSTVKGGTYFPVGLKKHLRAQRIAQENRLPCIYLADSGGIFLPLQAQTFADREHFGQIFYNQATMSAAGIAQVAVVLGMCTAGGAYVPAMADENIVVAGTGHIFLAGPPLVRAATGEEVDAEALGGGAMHATVSGVADHLANDEAHAWQICRRIVKNLHGSPHHAGHGGHMPAATVPPRHDPKQLGGLIPADARQPMPMRCILARLLDDSCLDEFKPLYGPTLICGFARWHGTPVGICANDGVLFGPSAQKGAHFIALCDKRGLPIVFLQNITGFMVGERYERGGIAKDGAKMVQAVSCARVPKVTVIVGASHGAGNYAMCGRAFAPRFLFTWPNARVSVMGPEQAAGVLVDVQAARAAHTQGPPSEAERQALMAPVVARYREEADAYYGTSRLWDDGIIDPSQTRDVVGLALAACAPTEGAPQPAPIYRM